MDSLELLVIFLLIMGIVTVVGHLIWVILGFIIGTISDKQRPSQHRSSNFNAYCPDCEEVKFFRDRRCAVCGVAIDELTDRALHSQPAKLEQIRRSLENLYRQKKISGEQLERMVDSILLEEIAERTHALNRATDIVELVEDEQAKIVPPPRQKKVPPVPVESKTEPPLPQKVPKPIPRKTFGDLLQSFMEEKNIRWGELVSGMLIVGSAIGLVISLWSKLEESIPYFPALIFLSVTLAIHGAGLYTLKKWKLQATSRGLLVISALLIPLNFLAAIALSDKDMSVGSTYYILAYILAVSIGLIAYSFVAVSTKRILFDTETDRRLPFIPSLFASLAHPFVLTLIGPCVGQLLISRLASSEISLGTMTSLTFAPFLSFFVGVFVQLHRFHGEREVTEKQIDRTLTVLGVAFFSLILCVGLLVFKTNSFADTLSKMTPALGLMGIAVMGAGLIIHRKAMTDALISRRIVGTSLLMTGWGFIFWTLIFAWPNPLHLVILGGLYFVVLLASSQVFRLPLLSIPSTLSLAFVILIAFHSFVLKTISFNFESHPALLRILFQGQSSLVTMIEASIAMVIAFGLPGTSRKKLLPLDRIDEMSLESFSYSQCFVVSSLFLAFVSMAVAIFAGFFPGQEGVSFATPVFFVASIVTLVACFVLPRKFHSTLSLVSSSLFFVSIWHLLSWNEWMSEFLANANWSILHPFTLATLIHATFAVGLSVVFQNVGFGAVENEEQPKPKNAVAVLAYSALASSCVALLVFFWLDSSLQGVFAIYAFWTMAIWLVISRMKKSPFLWNGAQLLSAAGTFLAVTTFCQSREWWDEPSTSIYFNQSLIASIALDAILWAYTKKQLSGKFEAFRYLKKTFPVETVMWGISLLGTFSMFGMGCVAGIRNELIDVGLPHFQDNLLGRYEILSVGLLSILNLLAVIFFFSLKELPSNDRKSLPAPTDIKKSVSPSEFWSLVLICLMVVFMIFAVSSIESFAGLTELIPKKELYPAQFGVTGWILLGILMTVSGLFFWLERNPVSRFGLIAALGLLPVLVAGQFVDNNSTASTLRWGYAIFGLAFALLKLVDHPTLRKKLQTRFHEGYEQIRSEISSVSRAGTIFAFVPVILISFYAITVAFRFQRLPAIPADSFFHNLGFAFSYSIPFFLLADSIQICFGRREFIRKYQTAAFLIATGVYCHFLMLQLSVGSPFDLFTWVNLMQIEGVTLAILALLGLVVFGLWKEHLTEENHAGSFDVLHYAALLTNLSLGFWAAFQIILDPVSPHEVVKFLGNSWVLAGMSIATVASFAYAHFSKNSVFRDLGTISLFALAAWPAAAMFERNLESAWFSYHAVIFGWVSLNLVICLGFFATKFWENTERELWNLRLQKYLTAGTTLVMLLVFAEFLRTREHLSLLVSVVALSATFIASVGVVLRKSTWAYASSFLAVSAGVLFGVAPWFELREIPSTQEWLTLVEYAVFSAGIASIFWLAVEVYFQKKLHCNWNLNSKSLPVHHAFPVVGLFFVASGIVLTMYCHLIFSSEFISREHLQIPVLATRWGWMEIALLGIVIVGSLWDRTARHALPVISILLLAIGFVALDAFDLTRNRLWVWSSWILSAEIFIAGCFWRIRDPLRKFANSIFVPTHNLDDERPWYWLPGMNALLAVLVTAAGFGLVILLPERRLRIWAAVASLACVPGFAMLSCEKWNRKISLFTLVLLPLAATEFVWAFMEYNLGSKIWLVRSIRLMEVLAVCTLLYAAAPTWTKARKSSWGSSLSSIVAPVGIATVAVLFSVLWQEWHWFVPGVGIEQISGLQIAVVAATLFGFIIALITMAVQPERDPFHLSERGKHFYVYASEIVAALLFLHIYLTNPDFFSGYFLPYWPFIVLGIAFFGAAVGEIFQRRKMFVLSEPLHRTGAFLPLFPALGFWTIQAEPKYQTVLFFAGLIYAMLSFWRKSFVYSVMAALAGNAALWALWSQNGLDISLQPQLWLIPPAVSVLLAAQLNHRRLTPTQLSSIRYPALIVIYLSSTGDMFLAGIGEHIWKPVILASLSILGVFVGISLRVRAFLYLGTSFLMMSLVSMVWHSTRRLDEVWPWWVFGIVTGLAILTIFGLFEKKRDEMRLLIDKLKDWEA